MRRVAIVGTGLIGGSLGLALRAATDDVEIAGYDEDPSALAGALDRGAVTETFGDATEAVRGADVVVLALPVDRVPQACWSLGHAVDEEAVVTDVGSAKAHVVREGEGAFQGRFVGGHPMAGSERRGIEAADPGLFRDAWWVLTPTERTAGAAYARVDDLVRRLGARPVAVDPETHDVLVARLSHLPQLTASALVDVAAGSEDRDALLGLAARGFRDVTRIAASDPDLWVAIIRSNRVAVLDALESFGGRLRELSEMVARDRWGDLRDLLERSRRARVELFAKPEVMTGEVLEPVGLAIDVIDRPGVLAEVTTAAGQLGVNIEDMRIVHSTEGGRGQIELVVDGSAAAESLVGALSAMGYRVDRSAIDR